MIITFRYNRYGSLVYSCEHAVEAYCTRTLEDKCILCKETTLKALYARRDAVAEKAVDEAWELYK